MLSVDGIKAKNIFADYSRNQPKRGVRGVVVSEGGEILKTFLKSAITPFCICFIVWTERNAGQHDSQNFIANYPLIHRKKCPLHSEQPTKFFADFVRCKLREDAKIADGGIAKVVRARFYHGAKIRLLLIFALVVNLLGSAFPKPC